MQPTRRPRASYKAVSEQPINASGTRVHLKDFGTIPIFRVVAKDGHAEHRATNDLEMSEPSRLSAAELARGIEEYHRGLEQHTGVDRCQHRLRKAQRNRIDFAIRAFVRLEYQRVNEGVSRFESKYRICREAIRSYTDGAALSDTWRGDRMSRIQGAKVARCVTPATRGI